MLTPTPTIDPRKIEILHQVHAQTIPVLNAILLLIILNFPIPFLSEKARLDFYFTLIKVPVVYSAAHHLPKFWALLLIQFYPFILFGIVFLLILSLLELIKILKLAMKPLVKRFYPPEVYTFLELTIPYTTSQSAYSTEQLFIHLHNVLKRKTFQERFFGEKRKISLEIFSTRGDGICYFLVCPQTDLDIVKRELLSFLPGIKIEERENYLTDWLVRSDSNESKPTSSHSYIVELKLSNGFALPLTTQKALKEHDPIAYLTGSMTKLQEGELVSFQIVATPVLTSTHNRIIKKIQEITKLIYSTQPLAGKLRDEPLEYLATIPGISLLWKLIRFSFVLTLWCFKEGLIFIVAALDHKRAASMMEEQKQSAQQVLNPYEQELATVVKDKIGQPLFETSIRFLIVSDDSSEMALRADHIVSSLGSFSSTYQSLTKKSTPSLSFLQSRIKEKRLQQFHERALSTDTILNLNPVISPSELADLYHFPYTSTTQTEGLNKSKTREMPIPLSMKREYEHYDLVIGQNIYGGEEVPIGLTLSQRQKHVYLTGKTGMGKSQLLVSCIYQDMLNGKGLAVFDPHGDMFQKLLTIVPKDRVADVVVFDPSDREYPVGLNLLAPNITFKSKDDADEWITSGLLSIFKRLTEKEYWGPRMEHVLRNATLTALQLDTPSLYTLQLLLTDKEYQRQVAKTLTDPVLKQFWQKEFGLMGNMQLSSVTAPLTQRLGHFITAKMSRHILLQETSTISIQKIMDEEKILLVNLSKGDLGEDQSFFFGTLLTNLIWMAAYQRTKIPEGERRDFFLYVDEFQNFATPRFSEITSEGRKFRINLTTSHQNIAQIEEERNLQVMAGNAHTIIALKGSPNDEKFILPFMQPEVEKGQIVNLPPYHFLMKVTTDESEDAFSGVTKLLEVEGSKERAQEVITYSRKHYATSKKMIEAYLEKLFTGKAIQSKKEANSTTQEENTDTPKTESVNDDTSNTQDTISHVVMAKKPKRKNKKM